MGKNMKKVFISLPVTSRPEQRIADRISEARRRAYIIADILKEGGYEVVTPFDVTTEGMSEAQCVGACITAMLECDFVYFYRGWQLSRGCRIEHLVAEEHFIVECRKTHKSLACEM